MTGNVGTTNHGDLPLWQSLAEEYDVVMLQETGTDSKCSAWGVPGYHLYSIPMVEGSDGRGLVALIRGSLKVVSWASYDGPGAQAIAVYLQWGGRCTLVVNVYISPESSLRRRGVDLDETYRGIAQQIRHWMGRAARTLVVGDLNAHFGNMAPVLTPFEPLPAWWRDTPATDLRISPQGEALFGELSSLGLVPLTGRTPSDVGAPSFVRGISETRIDHGLVDQGMLQLVTDSEILTDIEGTHHRPLAVWLKGDAVGGFVPVRQVNPGRRLVWKAENQFEYFEMLQAKLGQLSLDEGGPCGDLVEKLNSVIWDVADMVGMVKRSDGRTRVQRCRRHTSLFRKLYYQDAHHHAQHLRALRREVPQDIEAVRAAQKQLKRALRRVQRKHAALVGREVLGNLHGNPRRAWQWLRDKHRASRVVYGVHEWYEGLVGKFSKPSSPSPDVPMGCTEHPLLAPVLPSEVIWALRKSGGKSPGFDGIPGAFWRGAFDPEQGHTSNCLAEVLCTLFTRFLREGMPADWGQVVWSPAFKKAADNPVDSHRLISLTPSLYRVFMRVLNRRLQGWLEQQGHVPPEQFGFFRGRSCSQAVYALYSALHKRRSRGRPTYCAFMDLKAAYDTVDRGKLWYCLLDLGIPGGLVRCIKSVYDSNIGLLPIEGEGISMVQVPITRGVFQGCPLSPVLFNLYISDICQSVRAPDSVGDVSVVGGDGTPTWPGILYADDLVLWGESVEGLQCLISDFCAYAARKGLVVNAAKSKVMAFNLKGPTVLPGLVCDGEVLEWVSGFPYLGMLFTPDLDMGAMVKDRIRKGMAAMGACFQLLRNLHLRRSAWLAGMVFKVSAFPVFAYGIGFWGPRDWKVTGGAAGDRFTAQFWKKYWEFPTSTPTFPLLWELDTLPASYVVCTQAGYLWNSILQLPEGHFLKDWLMDDLRLSRGPWVHYFRRCLESIGRLDLVEMVREGFPFGLQYLEDACWEACIRQMFSGTGDPRDPSTGRRQHSMYCCWSFDRSLDSILYANRWSWKRKQQWLKLRLSVLKLGVHDHGVPLASRLCPYCGDGIHDLKHVLTECVWTASPFLECTDMLGCPLELGPTFWQHWRMHPNIFFSALGVAAQLVDGL